MRRLFLQDGPSLAAGAELRLTGEDHHYLAHVLRLGPGDPLLVLRDAAVADPGTPTQAEAEIVSLSRDSALLRVTRPIVAPNAVAGTPDAQGRPAITLLLGVLKGDKFDWVLQKATELGVHRVVPIACARSVPVLAADRAAGRQERWSRIVRAAAQQCRRPDLPQIAAPMTLIAALAEPTADPGLRLLLWETADTPLVRLLPSPLPPRLSVLVGPEGGWTEDEVAVARAAGYLPCGLSGRILRAETAALAILSVLDYLSAEVPQTTQAQ